MSNRKALHAYVSDKAHAAWHTHAAELGVSVSALLEVFGENISILVGPDAADSEWMVTDARAVDTARRRRSG